MVNIIIPLYKGREVLRDCLNSLVSQTKKQFLVTIVQDADEEDYSDILKEYEKKLHIYLFQNEKNIGPGASRQVGIDKTQMCDYVMFLDADDMLMPRAVEVLYSYAKSKFADVVIGKIMVERAHQDAAILEGNGCHTWMHAKIYNVKYLRDCNIRFFPNIRYNEDISFNIAAIYATQKRFYVNEVLYLWRDYKGSVTRDENSHYYIDGHRQFIYGFGLNSLRLLELNLVDDNLARTMLLTFYREYELMKFMKQDLDESQQIIRNVLKSPSIKALLEDPKKMKILTPNIICNANTKKGCVYFRENFDDFVYGLSGIKVGGAL